MDGARWGPRARGRRQRHRGAGRVVPRPDKTAARRACSAIGSPTTPGPLLMLARQADARFTEFPAGIPPATVAPTVAAAAAPATPRRLSPDTPNKVIYDFGDLLGVDNLGGTMRLRGFSYQCELAPGSLAAPGLCRRHDSRAPPPPVQVQLPLYEHTLGERGLGFPAALPTASCVGMRRLPGHPWYLAVQFHPEFMGSPRGLTRFSRPSRGELQRKTQGASAGQDAAHATSRCARSLQGGRRREPTCPPSCL